MITTSRSYLRSVYPLLRIPKPNHLFFQTFSQNQAPGLQEIIHDYIHLGQPEVGVSAYQTIGTPTIFLQNSILRCLSDHGYFAELLDFYVQLQSSQCHRSDNYTFPFVVKACAALFRVREGKEVHCRVLRTGYDGNVVIQTALVDMYAKNGCMEHAKKVFDEITSKDSVSWNALLCGYSSNGYVPEAFEVFRQMMAAGLKPSSSTFLSVIPLCACLVVSGVGRSLHGFAVKCGAVDNEALVPTLISMYAAFEDLPAARMLFEMLQTKDVIAWNSMISAYAKHGESDEAFELFKLMLGAHTRPNLITFVSIFPSCSKLATHHCGESLHAVGIKLGQAVQTLIVTALVSMYAKLGELNAAEYLFHFITEKSLVSWNSMISAYLVNGHLCMALDTFRNMQLEGVTPDAISMVSVISACNLLQDLLSGKSAHAYCLRKGFDSNVNVMNALLSLYSDHDHFSVSLKLFNKMPTTNLISWNTLISGWAKIGDTGFAIALFLQMIQQGVRYDIVTMISILPTFDQAGDLRQGMFFHALAIKNGYDSDTSLTNALISMYTNCGDVEAGRLLFDSLSIKSVVTWNALMTGYRNRNLDDKVMVLFDQMKPSGQKPSSVTLLNILPLCNSHLQGKSIHGYAVKSFPALESQFLTSTICMYAKFENFGYCRLLFDTVVDQRNVVSWNTMISVYAQNKHVEDAFACFQEMLRMGVEPDSVTILMLVSGCSQLGRLDMAHCIMAFILQTGFAKNTSIVNALIDMYARCGCISTAKELFDWSNKKDSITWSTMINGFGIHGDAETALKLFAEMKDAGVEPDNVTFVSILSACSHAGLVEQAQMLFDSMYNEHRIEPRMEHYACMVDLLGRTGHLEEAHDLLKTVTIRDSSSLLESLLGACRCHSNPELGEAVAAKLLVETRNSSSNSYVMLSNIYAGEGRWSDSRMLRSEMDAKGLRKDPGVSFVVQ